MDDVIALILGGGRGTRLFPLTQHRSKPAVPIGGNYRLIDVAVSNCLHANLRRIFCLTQYESESLNRHIATTYRFDAFSSGFVEVLAAEQTEARSDWFQGTADAVRQCMKHVGREQWKDAAILAGDQIYRMSFGEMLRRHRETGADATVAMKVVPAEETSAFGIMKADSDGRITHFDEKPPAERLPGLASVVPGYTGPAYLASMGIYIFGRKALEKALTVEKDVDFGRHIIPAMLSTSHVQAYYYDGYWEDVGTIRSYYAANLALTEPSSAFNFYHPRCPIYTHPRFLAPTKMLDCRVDQCLIGDGSYIERAELERSILGVRSHIRAGAKIKRTLLLGADMYETETEEARHGVPPLGVGEDTLIDTAIIDKNARIGRGVRIVNERKETEKDGPNYFIREGIVMIPKNAVIPDGMVI